MSESESPDFIEDEDSIEEEDSFDEETDAMDVASAGEPSLQDVPKSFSPPSPSPTIAIRSDGLPRGIHRIDQDDRVIVDALAGRSSVFGFGEPALIEAIRQAASGYLGDASAFQRVEDSGDQDELQSSLIDVLGPSARELTESFFLCSSADMAVETAIGLARRHRPEKSFRTVALVGSDHGRTAMGRTASGRPELHEDFGPMMAGFQHVPVGDSQALAAAVNEQTACVLLSPIDWMRSARALDADYLMDVRRVCDETGTLLVVDETQVVFGASGCPLTISSLADVRPDVVTLAAGLFGGLPGGIVVASQRVTGRSVVDAGSYPLLSAVARATLLEMKRRDLPKSLEVNAQNFAVTLAETISRFEFVRDVHVCGMSIGLETDLEASQFVRSAAAVGLRLEAAGEVAVRLQLPLVMDEKDQQSLLQRLSETLSAIEFETVEMGA